MLYLPFANHDTRIKVFFIFLILIWSSLTSLQFYKDFICNTSWVSQQKKTKFFFTAAECPRTDSLSSHDSMLKTPSRSMGKPAVTQPSDIDWGLLEDEPNIHKAKKQSSQIARELSDLVIYIQVKY